MASWELVQDPDVRVRVPTGSVMHAALVDAVRTMARRRALDDELAERLAAMTGVSAALAETADPAMLELTAYLLDDVVEITVAGIGPAAVIAAADCATFVARASDAQGVGVVDPNAATALVRFGL